MRHALPGLARGSGSVLQRVLELALVAVQRPVLARGSESVLQRVRELALAAVQRPVLALLQPVAWPVRPELRAGPGQARALLQAQEQR